MTPTPEKTKWIGVALAIGSSIFLTLLLCFVCKRSTKPKDLPSDEVLITIGDSVLTKTEITSKIPKGLSKEDSIKMFNTLATRWTEDMLLTTVSDEYPLLTDEIDRKVALYRRQLILAEYRKLIVQKEMPELSDKEVLEYYEVHKDEMRLEEPLVKGVCLKVTSNSAQLPMLRKWMQQLGAPAIEEIENNGLADVVQYDNFTDRWIKWEQLRLLIPSLPTKPDGLTLKEHTDKDCIWLIAITDTLPTGSDAPFDFVASSIREKMMFEAMDGAEKHVLRNLYDHGLKTGIVKPGSFIPQL